MLQEVNFGFSSTFNNSRLEMAEEVAEGYPVLGKAVFHLPKWEEDSAVDVDCITY